MVDLPQASPWKLQIVHHESTSLGTSQKSSNDGLTQPVLHHPVQPNAMLYPSSDYLSLRQVQHEHWTAAHAQTEMNCTSENAIQSRVDDQGDVGWDVDTLGEQKRRRTVASLNGGPVGRAATADATVSMQLARSDALRNAEWERAQPQSGPSQKVAKGSDDAAYPLLYSSSDDDDDNGGTDSKKLRRRERRQKQKRRKSKRKKKRSRGESSDDQDDSQSTCHAIDNQGDDHDDDDDDTVSTDSELARRRHRRRREKRRKKRKRYQKYRDEKAGDRPPLPLDDDDATVDSIPFAQHRKRQSQRTSPIQSMTADSVEWSSDGSSHSRRCGGSDDSDNGGSNRLPDKRKRRRNHSHAIVAERDDQQTANNDDKSVQRSGRKRAST
jgi:hypothetical protein